MLCSTKELYSEHFRKCSFMAKDTSKIELPNLGGRAIDRNILSQTVKCSTGYMSGVIKVLNLFYKFPMELLCNVLLNNCGSVC